MPQSCDPREAERNAGGTPSCPAAMWRKAPVPKRARYRDGLGDAPQDNKDCGYTCWIWGSRPQNLVEILTLGGSHEVHGSKIKRILCAEADTTSSLEHHVLKAFWRIKDVQKLEIPQHLERTQQERLTGVYSKLQAWTIFASGPDKLARVLMMDGDMILNGNMDDVFGTQAPAGVMRGEADTCLHDKRPPATYFQDGQEKTFTRDHRKMKGGINGGLVLLEPNDQVFKEMKKELRTFQTPTDMAEQDFLSWYYGRNGAWNALHKKFNFQVHHLYFSQGDKPPHGQDTASSYWWMMQNPADIKIYHYSSEKKPSNMLLEMPTEDVAWKNIEELVDKYVDEIEHTPAVWNRISSEIWTDEDLYRRVREASRKSLECWLRMWIQTWDRLLNKTYAALFEYGMVLTDREDEYCCLECSKAFTYNDAVSHAEMRDHLFFNCKRVRDKVWTALNGNEMNFDLRQLFYVPTGENVMKKIKYLAALVVATCEDGVRYDAPQINVLKWSPVVIENHPLYDLLPTWIENDCSYDAMHGTLVIDEPATEDMELPEEDRWAMDMPSRTIDRRYMRALASIRKRTDEDVPHPQQWPRAEQQQWCSSLRTAAEAVEWYMRKDDAQMMAEGGKKEESEEMKESEKEKDVWILIDSDEPTGSGKGSFRNPETKNQEQTSSSSSSSFLAPTAKARNLPLQKGTSRQGTQAKARPKLSSMPKRSIAIEEFPWRK